ncbi:EboA family metabolite traffic protein [Oscillatoria sp. CS-180]|uniref:EboA family metabolite traffic protein n=1 Tax=Oscillatoria sp. CS-180 TaxID=3021720 RepID=UPI00232DC7B2|nr:EboA family metabolite traffic protein [Oscillatoria sp. CS-180]MDB9528022.1 EboA family metabolite traffic protein [Oscillatoria sp. CS-180]
MVASTSYSAIALPDSAQVAATLHLWLSRHLTASGAAWLAQTLEQLSDEDSERVLFTRFSTAPRQVGKADLRLSEVDLHTAAIARAGWTPNQWSLDQAARTLLLLTFPSEPHDRYVAALEKLFAAADVAEQIALYQSLPVLPHPDRWIARAIDGLRTNITAVFNAIALHNPYPADYFDEAAWNQMVLKALFVDSRLSQIQRLEDRANPKLAQMLSDYAHERWAAGRPVNPQLWRPLGPFAEGWLVADLERALSSRELSDRQAAALACASAPSPDAQNLLDTVPDIKQAIATGQLTWDSFSLTHP